MTNSTTTRITRLLIPATSASVLALLANTTLASDPIPGFSGPFAVVDAQHPPGVYDFGSPPIGGTLGNWSVTLTPGGIVDTSGAPNAVVLIAEPFPVSLVPERGAAVPMGAVFVSSSELKIEAPAAGIFSFDFNINEGELVVFSDEGIQTFSSNGSLTLEVEPGENFGFRVEGDAVFNDLRASGRGNAQPAAPGFQQVTLSGVTFTAVPESTTAAGVLGLSAMVGGRWLLRRRSA